MKVHSIVLAGNGSYSNRGCEAILRGTTALLRSQLGACRFISNYFPTPGSHDEENENDDSIIHRPFPLLARYSLPWIEEQISRKIFHKPYNNRQVTRIFRHSLKEADAVLMLGGDNFSLDYPNKDIHFRISQLAVGAHVPTVIWGASVGPFFRDPQYERWAAKELSKVNLICARETATMEYLASISLTRNVILAADPSFVLQPTECVLPENIEKILQAGCIGLNLSPLISNYVKIDGSKPDRNKWANIAVDIVRNLLRQFSMPILLIPHVTSEAGFTTRDDYLFLNRVAKLLHEPERVLTLGPIYDAAQSKWVISRVRVFAGARTHSTLAAISTCVPTICIGYSMKAKGIAQDVYHHLDWLIKSQELVNDPTILSDRLDSLISNQTEIRTQLEEQNPVFIQRARNATERISKMID